MTPCVYRDGAHWVAELDHGTWIDRTPFTYWEGALEHAPWLGFTNKGGWRG